MQDEIPGGLPTMKRRETHLYWLLDTSGSMAAEGKIQSLNEALRQAAPIVHGAYKNNIEKNRGVLVVHALEFNDGARWVNADFCNGVTGDNFNWSKDLEAIGQTDMGEALEMVTQVLPNLPNNAFRPIIVLVTDGRPSDNFTAGLQRLMSIPQGKYAIRVAIAIGSDADKTVCEQFVGNSEIPVLEVAETDQLKKYIKMMTLFAATGKEVKAAELPFVVEEPAALAAAVSGAAPGDSGESAWI